MQAVVQNLPMYLQNKCCDAVHRIRRTKATRTFTDLVNFVRITAEVATEPVFSTASEAGGWHATPAHRKFNNLSTNSLPSSFMAFAGLEILFHF